MGQLDGKVTIVTGATSGIGEHIAEVFVTEGARVVGAGRREAEGHALEARLGDTFSFIRTDVAVEADIRAMINHALTRFGRLDCLVNNAGIPAPMISIAEVDAASFDNVFAVNVRGVLFGMKYAVPVMREQNSGSIINVGSQSGLRGGVAGHVYGASKAAVIHLSRSVAAELAGTQVRVNSISPGGIVTGIYARNAGIEGPKADKVLSVVAERFATIQPIARAGVTEDVARAAVYLASDGSSFVSGHDLVLDGGATAIAVGGWANCVAIRAELGTRIKAAIEEDC